MFTFFLVRGNWFKKYNYPVEYYGICFFLDVLCFGPLLFVLLKGE